MSAPGTMQLRRCEVALSERTVPYTVRESRRAGRIGLWMGPDTGLVVTVPAGSWVPRIEPFLRRHERWILRQVDRLTRIAQRLPARWPYGATLSYQGEAHRIRIASGKRSAVTRTSEGELRVTMRRPGIEGARRLLKRWFRDQAASAIAARASAASQALGLEFRSLSIRDQRRRWGSCSTRGSLSFNYRLIMAPPHVLDYVVIHELLHLREMNHSRRFWALVAQHHARHDDARAWLKTFGPSLGV